MSDGDPSVQAPTSRKLVLIVEDEPLLLVMASDMIEDAGFDVVTAANADDALLTLRQRSDVHIMFTDIRMPGSMDGLSLAAKVRAHFPPMGIVVTSGHERPVSSQLPARGLFLAKPYQERDLVAVVRSLAN